MSENFNYCYVVGKTDVGRKRAANEDNMYNAITQNGLVSVVCDGMGGHVGGATASQIAVSTIIENLNAVYYNDPRIAIGESIDRANQAILQKAAEQPELAGMGSTCVLLLVRAGKVYIGHVGDSRIYLVRSKRIVQLTKDHSYVQMLVDCGEITKEQAEHHPRKNEITNALGVPHMSSATVADDAIVPEAGDCFVLCSDGLSGMVSDDVICKIISRQSEMNAQERVDRLVALANENGGVDNITVQLVEFPVSPGEAVTEKKKFPGWVKIVCAVFVLAALGFGGYLGIHEKPEPTPDNPPVTEEEGQVEKCDTIQYSCPENILFCKNDDIVELAFNDSSLILKRKNKQIYVFNSRFDLSSLTVVTPDIKVQYSNSLLSLSFTDKKPEIVVFYITQSDKKAVHQCEFKVIEKNMSSNPIADQPLPKKSEQQEKPDQTEAKTTPTERVKIQFNYDKLEKGDRLLLNYSARKPSLIFKKIDEKRVGEKQFEAIAVTAKEFSYDNLYWEVKHDKDKQQFSFEFKGESTDKQTYKFTIPCIVKDGGSQVVISIELVPKSEKDNNQTENESDTTLRKA